MLCLSLMHTDYLLKLHVNRGRAARRIITGNFVY